MLEPGLCMSSHVCAYMNVSVHFCVCARVVALCVRAFVHLCVRLCEHACVRTSVLACMCANHLVWRAMLCHTFCAWIIDEYPANGRRAVMNWSFPPEYLPKEGGCAQLCARVYHVWCMCALHMLYTCARLLCVLNTWSTYVTCV